MLFSKPLSLGLLLFSLRTSKTVSLEELIYHGFYLFLAMVLSVLESIYYVLESFKSIYRFKSVLEICGDFGAFWK